MNFYDSQAFFRCRFKGAKETFVYNKLCNVSYAMLYNVTIDVGLINYAFCLATMYLEEVLSLLRQLQLSMYVSLSL